MMDMFVMRPLRWSFGWRIYPSYTTQRVKSDLFFLISGKITVKVLFYHRTNNENCITWRKTVQSLCPVNQIGSLPARCSLTDLQLYIRVNNNSEVQNGSDIGFRKQAPQNSLVCRWWKVETSHNHTLTSLYFSLLDHGSPHATRTNREDDRWYFCARSRQCPEVKFLF